MATNEFAIGQNLKAVSIIEEEFGGNELSLDQVKLFFEDQTVTLLPISDTDEIEIINEISSNSPAKETPCQYDWCRNFVGKKLMTVWVCENDQGYRDQVIFAFGYLQPSIAFVAEGSAIKVFLYEKIAKIKQAYNDTSNKVAAEC